MHNENLSMFNCAVARPELLIPMVQDGHPAGRTYAGKFVQALRCPHCAYTRFPTPSDAELSQYYQREYPASSASWYNVDTDYSAWKTRMRADRVERLIQPFGIGPGAWLHEFGCAFGGTVHALNARGYRASGTELNVSAVELGRQRGNQAIHAEGALEFLRRSEQLHDVIYSWHAIEHFTEPLAFLAGLADVLRPGGLLVLIVPSSAARFALVYGHVRYVWFGYPEHVHLFSPGCTPAIAQAINMQLVQVTTAEYGLEPEATRNALGKESEAAKWLRLVDPKLLGEELVMVFRKRQAADDHIELLERQTILQCESFAVAERLAMGALAVRTVDPWAAAPTADG
jgi:2-polyprenyl-3-methyl-5-hydroxy-6-metoxy-1,4-benzoquinol methylase